MKTVVIGTAGHIDHGKSALVRALTGTDPDRLKEEQARGITIDLGFAHLTDHETQLAFVDVPGHERFVRNMLAGAGGIDAVLLVVDAGESVMPQTREHFDICRLLGLERGVIALTKVDAAPPGAIERARAEIRALVTGSFLDGAAVVPVSARTGEGLDALRRALTHVAGMPPRQHRSGIVRLPIDRAFSVKGFGAVVTGTLVSGALATGDTLIVLPEQRSVRVRGLQVHGRASGEAHAPQRVAVNLAGVDAADLHRGMTLATAGSLAVTKRADVRVELLANAPALRHGGRVRAHQGASDVLARVSIASVRSGTRSPWRAAKAGDAAVEVPAGGEAYARLRFDAPMALTRGDRIVLRAASPQVTLGRATVLDPEPARAGVRTAATFRRFERLDSDEDVAAVLIEERAAAGLDREELVRRAGFDPASADCRLRDLQHEGRAVGVGARLIAAAAVAALEARAVAELETFHAAKPEDPGMARAALRERLGTRLDPGVCDAVLARLFSQGVLRGTDRVALARHQPPASNQDAQLQAAVEERLRLGGLTPPDLTELSTGLGVAEPVLAKVVHALVRDGRLVKAGALVFHGIPLEQLKQGVAALRAGRSSGEKVVLEVADFKARFGLTRKHAIPLLEWLDRERVTRRLGDVRVVL